MAAAGESAAAGSGEMYVPPGRADLHLRLQGIKDAAETLGAQWRPLRFSLSCSNTSTSSTPTPAYQSAAIGKKRLHLMRHGEGVHNKYMDDCKAAGVVPAAKLHEASAYPHLVDPVLTAQGEAEAVNARAKTAALSPELLVVSPLRRATDTCRLAFDAQWGGTPTIAHELCREGYSSGNIYDMHLPRSQLEKQFPTVDYRSFVEADSQGTDAYVDTMFVAGETDAQLSQRCYDFMCWVATRPEQDIAVVCHSKFLFALLVSAVDTDKPALRSWFETGEVRSMKLTITAVDGGVIAGGGGVSPCVAAGVGVLVGLQLLGCGSAKGDRTSFWA